MAVHLLEGSVLRHAQSTQRRSASGSGCWRSARCRRADARAQQPGRRRRPGHLDAARAGRRDAAQAGISLRPVLARRTARDARRHPGAHGRTGRQGAVAEPAGGLRPRGRARRLARRPRHHAAAGSSRRRSCRAASTSTGWTRSRRPWTRTCPRGGVRWLNYTVETELLMNEIEDSTTRISNLVGAAKQYSQLDRAPYQVADVHELLDSTLMMLAGRSATASGRQGLRPRRCPKDPGLPGRAQPGVDEPDRQRGLRDGAAPAR
jgi:hypothetical protein